MWSDLRVADLEVELLAETPVKLPFFRENALRAGLGQAVRRVVCPTPQKATCQDCLIGNLCAYAVIFCPTGQEGYRGFLRGLADLPRPYLSYFPPGLPPLLEPGQTFTLHLRLFGHAVPYYPYLLLALEGLAHLGIGLKSGEGHRGRFAVRTVKEVLPRGVTAPIVANGDLNKPRPVQGFTLAAYLDHPGGVSALNLTTLSPLRLKYNRHLDDSLQFHILVRNILRRLSGLYLLAYGAPLQLDYQGLIACSQAVRLERAETRWQDYGRYSTRQRRYMKLGGVVGRASYAGELTEIYPYVKAAEVLGVGKGTTFGFGRFTVTPRGGEKQDA